jgi:hypothetical protein
MTHEPRRMRFEERDFLNMYMQGVQTSIEAVSHGLGNQQDKHDEREQQ